jgi:hypothetical protein
MSDTSLRSRRNGRTNPGAPFFRQEPPAESVFFAGSPLIRRSAYAAWTIVGDRREGECRPAHKSAGGAEQAMHQRDQLRLPFDAGLAVEVLDVGARGRFRDPEA